MLVGLGVLEPRAVFFLAYHVKQKFTGSSSFEEMKKHIQGGPLLVVSRDITPPTVPIGVTTPVAH